MHRMLLIAFSVLAALASVIPAFASGNDVGAMNHNETFLRDKH